MASSQDILIDIFGRIEGFLVRLEIYTEVHLTPAMTDKMVQIMVEILDILAIATKEMKKGRASEFDLRFRSHEADIVSEKYLKRVMRVRRKDGMKTLDKLTSEVAVMAIEQPLKVTHNIENGRQRLFSESSAPSLILII